MTDPKHAAQPPYSPLTARPSREGNPLLPPSVLLGQSGRAGVIEGMIQTHMRIAARVKDVSDLVAATPLVVVAPKDPTDAERSFTDLASSLLREMRRGVPNHAGSLGESLGAAATGVWFGHWVGECSLYPDPTSEYGARLEVYDVGVSTIAEWVRSDTVLTGIIQRSQSSGHTFVPREDLAIVTFGDPWPTGEPRLRPAVFWYEMAKELAISFSEQAANASGILVLTASDMVTQAQMDRMVEMMIDFKTEAGTHTIVVGGSTGAVSAQMVSPSSVLDPTTYLSYFDGQLDQLMQSALSSLGLTSGTGSMALGQVLKVVDEEQWDASMRVLLKKWGDEVIGWIARRAKYTGRMPHLERERATTEASPEEDLAQALSLVQAGVLSKDDPRIGRLVDKVLGELSAEERKTATAPEATVPLVMSQDPPAPEVTVPLGVVSQDPANTHVPIDINAIAEDYACGCGHDHPIVMSAKGSYELVDAFGDSFTSGKAMLSELESTVMWGRWEDMRAERDLSLQDTIGDITTKFQADLIQVLQALPEGVTPSTSTEVANLTAEAEADVRAAVEAYAEGVASDQAQLVRDEYNAQSRQADADMTPGDVAKTSDALGGWVDAESSQVPAMVDASTTAIVSRAKGEVVAAFVTNPAQIGNFSSRQTPKGLASEAAPLANRIEDVARVRESLQVADDDGLVVIEATRVHVRDTNACQWCVEHDGTINPDVGKAIFPKDLERFATSGVFNLPDPNCEGGLSCRCGVVLRYGRP